MKPQIKSESILYRHYIEHCSFGEVYRREKPKKIKVAYLGLLRGMCLYFLLHIIQTLVVMLEN
jgi:hypothetical protein